MIAVSWCRHCHSAPESLCLGLATTTVPHGHCVLVWALPQCPTVAVSRSRHCHSAPRSLCLGAGTATVPHGHCVSVRALPQCPQGRCVSVQALPQCPTVAVPWSSHCHSAPRSLCLGLGTATVPHGRCVSVQALPQQSLCLSLGTATVPHSHCVSVQALTQCPTVAVSRCGHCHSPPRSLWTAGIVAYREVQLVRRVAPERWDMASSPARSTFCVCVWGGVVGSIPA